MASLFEPQQPTRRDALKKGLTGLSTALLLPSGLLWSAQALAGTDPQPSLQAQVLAAQASAKKLITAARTQVGQTLYYDGSYAGLAYPNGDVPMERGVCTDVIIRAYRKAFSFDLQKAVHEDMRQHFSAYPTIWRAKKTDRNIDHRRVPNLQTFFKRQGAALRISDKAEDYLPGDIVTQMLPRNLPHIAIVSDKKNLTGATPLVIHNIGAGAREENSLFSFTITGHYRFYPNSANL